MSASGPPSAPALAIPLPQTPSGARGGDGAGVRRGGEKGACATRGPAAPSPRAVPTPPLGTCSLGACG